MNIDKTNSIQFTSYRNPIKPFNIKTNKGLLHFREVSYNHPQTNCFYSKLSKFFIDNFAASSFDPSWEFARKNTLDFNMYSQVIKYYTKYFKKIMTSKNSTILYSQNPDGDINAAIAACPLKINKELSDSCVLYISSLAVDSKYRHNNVANELLNRVLNTEKKDYTDVFLVAYRSVLNFYLKNNFKIMNYFDSEQSFFISKLMLQHPDYPVYSEFLSRPLNYGCPVKWYKRIFLKSTYKN